MSLVPGVRDDAIDDIVDRLAALPLVAAVPRAELEWLVEHGEVRTLTAGTVLDDDSTWADEMWIMLTGRVSLYRHRGGASRKLLEVVAGAAMGTLPYSRFQRPPGMARTDEDVTAVVLHRRHFPALMRDHPELTTALVHHMLDRSVNYRSVQLNDERLESLSRLASGFAHELNNPASAAARTARSLVTLLDDQERAARELAEAGLTGELLDAVEAIRQASCHPARGLTALEAADREDDLAEWLERHGLLAETAAALASSDVTLGALDQLARSLPPDTLRVALQWVVTACAARVASRDIETSTARIHALVDAVKGFTFMDRQGVPEPVDIARGLADTLVILEGKARAKSARVSLETADDLPKLHGFGSEINQVWEKLVANAIDAIGEQGSVVITASRRADALVVRVADDGPGIPEAIQARVFDPFFTTKPVGQGTGLGLDIARRIVHLHGGDIEFHTQPGRTVFRVSLPIEGDRA